MFQNVTESLAIGNITSSQELQAIYEQGYRTIIDLCTEPENNKLNGEEVQKMGFNYIKLPVDHNNLNPQILPSFIQAVNSTSQPIYTHCASGWRAGVMTLLSLAHREHWTEEKYLEQRQVFGLDQKPNSALEAYSHQFFVQ